ncbi:hypothetical protein Q428_01905 [Fervidicella metallireducens AeB]|uniref:GH18 domain-containing protein n=1 Tax=Fervidicella metallireducens AeB TaxID=1403537 RepID=A0A017RY73_9CLOT|nr:glycosyl hydrolase family 18 protein [Fervidicella metallireducens]EYE89597.1 hypothetical protein Q428_01905 [Fervidicella metallireducens AeB]
MKAKRSLVIILMTIFLLSLISLVTFAKQQTFKPYKVTVTAKKLNIRQKASSTAKIIGYYNKGNIVDIIGKSGSYLKTSKGYILSQYTKTLTVTNSKTQNTTSSKVVQTTGNSKNTASSTKQENTGNDIKSTDSPEIPKNDETQIEQSEEVKDAVENSDLKEKYIEVNEDTPLLLDISGKEDERYAVKGKKYKVLEEIDGFYKIKIGRITGFLPKSKATALNTIPKNKVTIAWDYTNTKNGNKFNYDESTDYVNRSSVDTGFDVLSPTWFGVTGDYAAPKFLDLADIEYTKIAHRNGYEVWARFAEMTKERASYMFKTPSIRARIIEETVQNALKYNVDGINIDFEGLGSVNKEGFTAFVKDLSERLKKEGLSVSVDVMKPYSWSLWFNAPVIQDYVDYVIYMAYDEHYSGSKTPGSVGSYTWVKEGIDMFLKQGVKKEKLVLAVPFYMRDFGVVEVINPQFDTVVYLKKSKIYYDEKLSSNKVFKDCLPDEQFKYLGLSSDKKSYKVDCFGITGYVPVADSALVKANTSKSFVINNKALSSLDVSKRIINNIGTLLYDENARQSIGAYVYPIDGLLHKVWIENEDSMAWRMDLINEYDLAGAAAWSLYWKPTEAILSVIKQKMK